MFRILTLVLLLAIISNGDAFVKWTGLRVTWCYNPKPEETQCFEAIPRTAHEAEAAGYAEIKTTGGCYHHGRFHGRRFAKKDNIDITPLYDINGIIAGLQIHRPKSELFAKPNPYQYSRVPVFQSDIIRGTPVYTHTFYFVHPNRICRGGRTEQELEEEGTGTGLWIQNGPNTHEHNLIRVPLYRDAAIEQRWSDNLCVDTMGQHNYYDVPSMQPTNCTVMRPMFLTFNNEGELHGYGSVGMGTLQSNRFERPDDSGVMLAVLGEKTPQCQKDYAMDPGYSNVHVFFVDNPLEFKCAPWVQVAHSRDIYNNPNTRRKFYVD